MNKKFIASIVALALTASGMSAFAYSTGNYTVKAVYPNYRSGPSLNSSVLGQLEKGRVLNITQVSDGWGYISDLHGWVRLSGGFVEYSGSPSPTDSKLYKVRYNGTNVRRGPSLNYGVVTQVNSGTVLTITKTEGQFGYIPSYDAWIRLTGFCDYVGAVAAGSSAPTQTPTTPSNQANAITEKALSHVGYIENSDGWSKFGQQYANMVNDSSFSKAPWCAMYVTDCARDAGISSDIIPTFASCSIGRSWFESRGLFRYRNSGYTPKKGDLIFFTYGHVGIVTGTGGSTVYTVEGNAHNGSYRNYGVRKLSYNMSNGSILGYATPAYR